MPNKAAAGEDNFPVARPLALPLKNDRLARLHQGDFLVLRRFPNQCLPSLRGEHSPVLIRIIEDGNHPNKPVRRLQEDFVFPEEQFRLETLDGALEAKVSLAITLVGALGVVFELLHQVADLHNFVRLQCGQFGYVTCRGPRRAARGGFPRFSRRRPFVAFRRSALRRQSCRLRLGARQVLFEFLNLLFLLFARLGLITSARRRGQVFPGDPVGSALMLNHDSIRLDADDLRVFENRAVGSGKVVSAQPGQAS